MESDTKTSPDPPTTVQAARAVSAPTLPYAPPRRFARLRRWIGPGSPLFFLLILALAGAGTWGAWKWRLKADEKAFNERTYHGHTGFKSLGCLELQASQVTDAGLKELARPDSGLKGLTSLQLFASDQVRA